MKFFLSSLVVGLIASSSANANKLLHQIECSDPSAPKISPVIRMSIIEKEDLKPREGHKIIYQLEEIRKFKDLYSGVVYEETVAEVEAIDLQYASSETQYKYEETDFPYGLTYLGRNNVRWDERSVVVKGTRKNGQNLLVSMIRNLDSTPDHLEINPPLSDQYRSSFISPRQVKCNKVEPEKSE